MKNSSKNTVILNSFQDNWRSAILTGVILKQVQHDAFFGGGVS